VAMKEQERMRLLTPFM